MSDLPPTQCTAGVHLSATYRRECERPAQLVLVHQGGTASACRACAAVFTLHNRVLWALAFPEFPQPREVGALRLSGKQRTVYLHVLRGIQRGEWEPGQAVPTSAALATVCRCARSTATRALRALVADGWLVAAPGPWDHTVAPAAGWPHPKPTVERRVRVLTGEEDPRDG